MDEVPVVTVFLRHRGEVLLLRRSDEVGSYSGRWGAVAGHLQADDPVETAYQEIEEETGLSEADVTLVREGPSFPVEDEDRGTRWVVHPFLFDAASRSITPNWETEDVEWASPTALLRRDTVPELWTSYRRVAPSIVSLSDDTTHGSAYLSIRALEVLRDRAGVLAATEAGNVADARERLVQTAHRLLDTRPSMAALANRVHRVLHASRPDLAPATVESRALDAIGRALDAEEQAAAAAAEHVDGQRVLTLSRSGTVQAALRRAAPDAVAVATSHPGGEGIAVAEALSDDGLDVTLLPDAGVAALLDARPFDLVLVGADTVYPSGAVANKVGTFGVALAAHHADVPFFATCTVDKVSVDASRPTETADRRQVYDGPTDLQVYAPRFDVTAASLVTGGIVTDRGALTPEEIGAVAEDLGRLRDWN